jgi:outer membrane receptor protein involved in Fe transport
MKAAVSSLAILVALTATVAAQVSDVEVPTLVMDGGDSPTGQVEDESLDLANIVQSAAKGITTIQEAPAIVTVVTADDIRDRQIQDLLMLADTVPGWQRLGLTHSVFPIPIVRGQVQAVQFLQDGLSVFDPMANMPTITRQQPMELIKRVEMITGPGGVLWGSNSLLGIMNVITKDAEDLEGIEVGSGIGHGKGDRLMARAYVMAGKSGYLDGKLNLFGHASVDTYQGAEFDMPLLLFHQPLPQPNSGNFYGPLTSTDQPQSLIVNLSGKATMGKLKLRVQYPLGNMYKPIGLSGNPVVTELPEDSRCMDNGTVDLTCIDNLRTSRSNQWIAFDRFVVAEYKDRFANGKAGITLRGYAQEFMRGLFPLAVLAPSTLIQGGLAFNTNMKDYRVGAAFDGDVEIGKPVRVLYGGEAFREWLPDHSGRSIQGPGNPSDFEGPYDLTRLPLPCPRKYNPATMAIEPLPGCPLTFAFAAERSVLGAYVNPQLRPNKKLILDAGARVQVAPEQLGSVAYDMRVTTAGTIVWNFIPNWHLKLNYTQGFRPPVFNNTSSNGEAVQIAGDPNLKVETSDAMQAEINARVFKGSRRIRELSFRIDGSYTRLTNLIQVNAGAYGNSGDRGISSGEFLGKLYVQGGHRLELAYTWMRVASEDRGLFKALPEHFFNFTTVFNLVTDKLTATTNLKVTGAAEDPNRLVEYRDTMYDANGYVPPAQVLTVNATDMTLDRLPPIAELSLGLTWTPVQNLLVRATVYNALLQHHYQPDPFFDYEPHLEYLPNPYEGIRAYLSAMYQY